MNYRGLYSGARALRQVTSVNGSGLSWSSHLQKQCKYRGFASETATESGFSWKRESTDQGDNEQTTVRENPFKSLCKLTLIGRTGASPEIRSFDDGSRSLSLSVATNFTSGIGANASVETQWHRVYLSEYVPGFSFISELPTGSLVYIEGNMKIQTSERDGSYRQYVNVHVNKSQGTIRVLSTPSRSNSNGAYGDLPF